MRKIKIIEHISLDGIISAGREGEYSHDFENGGWTAPYRSPEGLAAVLEAQGNGFDLLLGRRTYDLWSAYWPKAGNSLIANGINNATKYIATHNPGSLEWGPVKDLGTDVIAGICDLKSTSGPDLIVWGSSTLTSLLLDKGLADEVVLIAYPVLLGRGNRFFADNVDPRELALISTKTLPTGVLVSVYKHVGSLQTSAKE